MNSTPVISVILPAYNAEEFIAEAIQSILVQTFTDFELIVINDASTDNTLEILNGFNDPRIKIINNPVNLRVVKSLNIGLELARGTFIARMDADDISLPQRFERQYEYLQTHPDVDVCGTWVEVFGEENHLLWPYEDHDNIKAGLLFLNIMVHPSIMFRSSAFKNNGFKFDESFVNAEDYGMWAQIIDRVNLAHIPEVLLRYRYHSTNASVLKEANRSVLREMNFKAYRIFLDRMGITPTQEELDLHFNLGFKQLDAISLPKLSKYLAWLMKIKTANEKSNYIDHVSLRNVIIHLLILLFKKSNKSTASLVVMIKAFARIYGFSDYKEFISTRAKRRVILKTLNTYSAGA